MKTLTRSILPFLALSVCLSASAFAVNDGGDHSGGGSDAVAAFVRSAKNELDKLDLKKQSEVDVSVLRNTLDTAQFKVTSTLIDPRTGTAVDEGEHLIAFGSPGLIQLKPDWTERVVGPKRVVHHIVHELMRASGKYNDEGYRITITKLNLDLESCESCGPAANTSLSNIGQDAAIRLERDICFEPNMKEAREFASRDTVVGFMNMFRCDIIARQTKNHSRIIPAGTTYRITTISARQEPDHDYPRWPKVKTRLEIDSPTIDSVTCTSYSFDDERSIETSLGQFQSWSKGILTLSTGTPEVVR